MVFLVMICGITALTGYLVYLLYLLWQSAKRLFAASADFGRAFSEFTQPKLQAYRSVPNVYTDPSRKANAQKTHAEISAQRATQRKKRLDTATERWNQMSSANFANIDANSRKHAKEYRQARHAVDSVDTAISSGNSQFSS